MLPLSGTLSATALRCTWLANLSSATTFSTDRPKNSNRMLDLRDACSWCWGKCRQADISADGLQAVHVWSSYVQALIRIVHGGNGAVQKCYHRSKSKSAIVALVQLYACSQYNTAIYYISKKHHIIYFWICQ